MDLRKFSFEKDVEIVTYTQEVQKKVPVGNVVSGYFVKGLVGKEKKECIIVYQAFNEEIASYAVKNQKFGGKNYSLGRMTWIKTNFLWMMYRCGWCQKDKNQAKVLAIYITTDFFESQILSNTIISSYPKDVQAQKRLGYENIKPKKKKDKIVLQWDPQHSPSGGKLVEKRAIQLGMKGSFAAAFRENILRIEDVTPFVLLQYQKLKAGKEVQIPKEVRYVFKNQKILDRVLSTESAEDAKEFLAYIRKRKKRGKQIVAKKKKLKSLKLDSVSPKDKLKLTKSATLEKDKEDCNKTKAMNNNMNSK